MRSLFIPLFADLILNSAVLAQLTWVFAPLPGASSGNQSESWASGINSEGVVAGYTVDNSGTHPSLWLNTQPENFGPANLVDASFPSINDEGQVAGYWTQETDSNGTFIFSTAGYVGSGSTSTLLQNNGTATLLPMAINNAGIVVGAFPSNGDAVTYDIANGTVVDYGQFGAEAADFTAINNTGLIAGTLNFVVQPTEGAFVLYNGQFQTLVGLAGRSTFPEAINDSGIIVGTATDPQGKQAAVTWAETGPSLLLNSNHQLQLFLMPILSASLPLFAGATASGATDINSANDIVGWMQIGSDPGTIAVLWANGGVIDLNTLLPVNSGWILNDATGINDAGQIVGNGTYKGQEEAFLLTPDGTISIPEPAEISLAAGFCLLATRRRQK